LQCGVICSKEQKFKNYVSELRFKPSKWMQLEDIMVSEVSQVQKHKGRHVFSHIWKMDPKDKHIHKDRHDHTQTQMWNMCVTVELLYGTWGRRDRKRE
jgi:hypothetical protein